MVSRIGDINGIPLYNSLYVEDYKLYKSHDSKDYIIVSVKTGKEILKKILLEERKKKLNSLF